MLTPKNEKIIADLISRVDKLERAVFANKSVKSKPADKQNFQGATGGLRYLVAKGFFDRKRNFGEIKKGLADNNYHYSNQAVQTPLNNLSKSGGLLVSLKEKGKKVYAKRK